MDRVKIANNQRRIALDLKKWKALSNQLGLEVFKNIREEPPAHLALDDIEAISEKGSVAVQYVSNKKIRELNNQWRQKDYATDVLSFPLIFEQSGASFLPELDEMPELELGDIIISLEKAEEQATEYGHSFERELAFLFVHGLLHVLGFDHETDEQEKDMFSRQNQVLNCLGIVK